VVKESYIAHNSGSQKQMFGRRCLWLESDLFLVAETNRMICPHFVLDSNVRTLLLSYGNKRFHKVFYLLLSIAQQTQLLWSKKQKQQQQGLQRWQVYRPDWLKR